MTTIIAIASQKGGSGKTTLAVHLATRAAVAKHESCVIDTDPQATAATWSDWRGDFLPVVVTAPPARLTRTIESAKKNGVDFIVIDTPPHADAAAREAIKAADIVLIPTKPRAFDLAALEPIADLVSFAETPAFVVLNAVPSGATVLTEEAKSTAKDMKLAVCPVELGDRAAFHRSSAKGETAAEIDPEGKAAKEIEALWKWLNKAVKKAKKAK
ncbi:chromosome partitioning protein ParA [Erythrobacter sp. KY5]|uniref:ParA family partition ATPase n=1 Tax=Erythrobacter sp. KY5 TaxID=2011159 RepID=UPI000DBF25F0|nr:ParA family partition ATPase [Erythrobacter sp. KY5]AWW74668.1 chromosome partitioning protein ParA [Erythrobacter sp. KY5]